VVVTASPAADHRSWKTFEAIMFESIRSIERPERSTTFPCRVVGRVYERVRNLGFEVQAVWSDWSVPLMRFPQSKYTTS